MKLLTLEIYELFLRAYSVTLTPVVAEPQQSRRRRLQSLGEEQVGDRLHDLAPWLSPNFNYFDVKVFVKSCAINQ